MLHTPPAQAAAGVFLLGNQGNHNGGRVTCPATRRLHLDRLYERDCRTLTHLEIGERLGGWAVDQSVFRGAP